MISVKTKEVMFYPLITITSMALTISVYFGACAFTYQKAFVQSSLHFYEAIEGWEKCQAMEGAKERIHLNEVLRNENN